MDARVKPEHDAVLHGRVHLGSRAARSAGMTQKDDARESKRERERERKNVVPAHAGTHTPCALDTERSMGPGPRAARSAGMTIIFAVMAGLDPAIHDVCRQIRPSELP